MQATQDYAQRHGQALDVWVAQLMTAASAQELLVEIADLVTIAAIDSRMVNEALRFSFPDFEGAPQYFAATAEREPALAAIVTRDPKGFAAGTLPILTPPRARAQLGG